MVKLLFSEIRAKHFTPKADPFKLFNQLKTTAKLRSRLLSQLLSKWTCFVALKRLRRVESQKKLSEALKN